MFSIEKSKGLGVCAATGAAPITVAAISPVRATRRERIEF
jgi:hypothetical protein